jgi:predicted nucleic acid-binding protein
VRVYLDTSVLLRVVMGERDAIRNWAAIDAPIASVLVRVEALRTIDRSRLRQSLSDDDVAERRADVLRTLSGCSLVPLDGRILERSAEAFPTALGTLDAIHLSTALLVRAEQPDLAFATHDRALATAARAVGFRVLGAPA